MAQIVIVGAGHNGLVCAYYLAKAGHSVTILEKALIVGGACRNERWTSGATVSPGANHFGMLNNKIASDMGLWKQGLTIVRAAPQLIVGLHKGESLALFDDVDQTREQIKKYSVNDAKNLNPFFDDIGKARSVIDRHVFDVSPSLSDFTDDLRSASAGLEKLFLHNSIKQTLEYYFESQQVKALFSATGFLYNAGPEEPGTSFTLAYLSLINTHGVPGWGVPLGGMGRVVELMEMSTRDAGASIATGRTVTEILLRGNKAIGVKCSDGTVLSADHIVSNTDPYTTFVKLAGQSASSLAFWDESTFTGPCAKFNFVFRGSVSPDEICERHVELLPRSAYVYLPSIEFAQAAFTSAKSSGYSHDIYFEFVTPSAFDPKLCAPDMQIGSLYCLFASYDLLAALNDKDRNERKKKVFDTILRKLKIKQVVESEQLDPIDIERKFGMHKGNVDHGSPVISNIFEHRNTERLFGIDRLTICGSGSHPGGLVSGIPGYNAAQKVLAVV